MIENEWITLADGTRLAARLWIPSRAATSPVPVVWEYLPYRKRDAERRRDTGWAEAFVPHGFAFVRVDIRGTGDSDGILLGEYRAQEQFDVVEVIRWLARQPWSNGAVGMRGISWGGFSSLQAAALAPPELKAIIPQCASDNRYTHDAHYVGGALTLDNYDWGDWTMSITEGDPNSSVWRLDWFSRLRRGSWDTTLKASVELRSSATEFHIQESIEAYEDGRRVFVRDGQKSIVRDLV